MRVLGYEERRVRGEHGWGRLGIALGGISPEWRDP